MLDKIEAINSIDTINIDTIVITKNKKNRSKKKRVICRPVLFISDSSSSDTE